MVKIINRIGAICAIYFALLTANACIYMVFPLLSTIIYVISLGVAVCWGIFLFVRWIVRNIRADKQDGSEPSARQTNL